MMKKFLRTFLSVLLVLTMVISVTACGDKPDPDNGEGDGTSTLADLNVSAALGLDLFETKTLEATDKNGAKVNATWQVADASIATVTSNGTVSAKAVGQTKVTASYNGNTAECTVTVRDSGERPNLWLSSTTKTMIVGGKTSATPSVTYKGVDMAADITVAGGNSEVATYVVENGVVTFTGVAIGTTTVEISGICGGYTLTPITVTVNVVDSTSLIYADGDLTLCTIEFNGMKTYHEVSIDVYNNQGALVPDATLVWTSSDEEVAKYNAINGKIEAAGKAGKTTIRATYGTVYVEFEVEVLRAETTVASGLSVSDNYKKLDLTFLADFIQTDYTELTSIYDETNGKEIAFTLDTDGTTAILSNYSGVKGYMNWVFNTRAVAIKTEVAHATHRIATKEDFYALKTDWEANTLGNILQTIAYSNNTKEWLIALAADIDFEGVKRVNDLIGFGSNYAADANLAEGGWSNPDFDPRLANFCGIFDGRGFAIKNGEFVNGFCCNLNDSGVIRNLAIINAKVLGGGGVLGNYGRGTVENCYINGQLGESSAQAALYYYTSGTKLVVKNVIMNVTVKEGATGSYCFVTSQGGASNKPNMVENSFGISDKLEKIWAEDTTNGAGFSFKTVAAWKSAVGNALHSTFNGYWTLSANSLSFGANTVLAW